MELTFASDLRKALDEHDPPLEQLVRTYHKYNKSINLYNTLIEMARCGSQEQVLKMVNLLLKLRPSSRIISEIVCVLLERVDIDIRIWLCIMLRVSQDFCFRFTHVTLLENVRSEII